MGLTCMKISECAVKSNAHGTAEQKLDFFQSSHSCFLNTDPLYWQPLKARLLPWLLQPGGRGFQRGFSSSP